MNRGKTKAKTTAGRGSCLICKTRQPLSIRDRKIAPHPIPGNARGASRCSGTGLKPIGDAL